EGQGGKVHMIRAKALKGIDAAIMAHPSWRTTPDTGSTAVCRYNVIFHGKAAHAASSPELGRNALDAVMLLFQGVNAWRQHLPETCRVHGIVTNGGAAPNIIPDLASCYFYLRSTADEVPAAMRRHFADIARGAALMTGTRLELQPVTVPYRARRPNHALNEAYRQYARDLGLNPVDPSRPGRGSSDFGDVSQVVPGAHVYFGIARREIAGHSTEFLEAARSDYGISQALRAAEALANVGYRYFIDKSFRNEVSREFRKTGIRK
ncbi:MAG: peptidase dimerization domain-containing protein, partial [Lentisphaerae bacterium]|nr:peptidase dimerization domain-containing protein [Lentisphaerota bacterium]